MIFFSVVGPENLPIPYLKALLPSEEETNLTDATAEETRKFEESEDDNQESLKEIADNPYMKPPKKAKLK